MEKIGAKEDSIASDPLKEMGSFARAHDPAGTRRSSRAWSTTVSRSSRTIVRSGRPKFEKDPAALDKLATGQVFTAEQAQKNGLIDKIGFLEDAVDRAIELAKLDKDKVNVVRYKPEVSLASLFLGGQAEGRVTLDLRMLLELSSPRAYYLCTWLPRWPARQALDIPRR